MRRGGKAKNDKLDSHKIAVLLRGADPDGVPDTIQELWLGPATRHGRIGRGLIDHAVSWLSSKNACQNARVKANQPG
jgi:hypothetical protein